MEKNLGVAARMKDVEESLLKAAQELYDHILHVANQFLRNVKIAHITILAQENPSYEQMVATLAKIEEIIYLMADDLDPMLATKAGDYIRLMKRMAIAITNQDAVELSQVAEELDSKPFL